MKEHFLSTLVKGKQRWFLDMEDTSIDIDDTGIFEIQEENKEIAVKKMKKKVKKLFLKELNRYLRKIDKGLKPLCAEEVCISMNYQIVKKPGQFCEECKKAEEVDGCSIDT